MNIYNILPIMKSDFRRNQHEIFCSDLRYPVADWWSSTGMEICCRYSKNYSECPDFYHCNRHHSLGHLIDWFCSLTRKQKKRKQAASIRLPVYIYISFSVYIFFRDLLFQKQTDLDDSVCTEKKSVLQTFTLSEQIDFEFFILPAGILIKF